ncbi:MAG: hypothetical protein KGV54_00710 [Oceanivirga sp.]|nr:hypothetical protein [Oceanivirga sp.]
MKEKIKLALLTMFITIVLMEINRKDLSNSYRSLVVILALLSGGLLEKINNQIKK